MNKYEYTIDRFYSGWEYLKEYLDMLGEARWELVAIKKAKQSDNKEAYDLILKRIKQ